MKKIILLILLFAIISLIFLKFNDIFFLILNYQRELISLINNSLKNESLNTYLILLIITFIYGLVHSMGPGHGKTLIITYSLQEKIDFERILVSSFLIAYLQGCISFLLVIFIINLSSITSLSLFYDLDSITRIVSSIIIFIIALFTLYNLFLTNKKVKEEKIVIKNLFLSSFLIGLFPCSGVISVLLFFKSFEYNGNLIPLVISMSTGVFISIFFSGYLTNKLKYLLIKNENFKIYKVFSISLALLLLIFSGSQLIIFFI